MSSFEEFWDTSGMGDCYSSSQARRRFKLAYKAGRESGLEKAAEICENYKTKDGNVTSAYLTRLDVAEAIRAEIGGFMKTECYLKNCDTCRYGHQPEYYNPCCRCDESLNKWELAPDLGGDKQ